MSNVLTDGAGESNIVGLPVFVRNKYRAGQQCRTPRAERRFGQGISLLERRGGGF
jgi:hypothetical protein